MARRLHSVVRPPPCGLYDDPNTIAPTAARAQTNVSDKNRMLFRTNRYLRKNGLRDPVWQEFSTDRHWAPADTKLCSRTVTPGISAPWATESGPTRMERELTQEDMISFGLQKMGYATNGTAGPWVHRQRENCASRAKMAP